MRNGQLKPGINWLEIENRIRSGEKPYVVSKDFDISRQAIDKRARKLGLGIYFKKDGKTLSDKPHYDVRGRNSAWKWIGGKESKTSRKSKTAIIDNNLLNLPEEFIELAKSYRDEL